MPHWKPTRNTPRVRVHEDTAEVVQQLFNEPLDIHRGEIIRLDLAGARWFSPGARAHGRQERGIFLALLGDDRLPTPEPGQDWYAQRAGSPVISARASVRRWRALERLEQFNAPCRLAATLRPPVAKKVKYKTTALSSEDSARIRENSSRLCGFSGDTNFHLAATLVELHRLQQRAAASPPATSCRFPSGCDPRARARRLFSNQLTMMLHQFLPGQLETARSPPPPSDPSAAGCLRDGDVDSSIALAQLFRALPLRFYMWMVKHELRGEICSLFFATPARLTRRWKVSRRGNKILRPCSAVTVPRGSESCSTVSATG